MPIKLYWFRGKGKDDPARQNFGDYLSPMIVEMVASKPVQFSPVDRADMIAIGTIMSREQRARRFLIPRRLHVWGSGTDTLTREFSERHYYHAVRGEITRSQIIGVEGKSGIALGDPGLLANYWWEGRPKPVKKYRIGIVPHYVDQDSELIRHAAQIPGVAIIDVFWPVAEVMAAIQECDFILSSSMHGLIIADSFGIPNRRIRISDKVLSNDKFKDYYSAFSMQEPAPVTVMEFYENKPGDIDQLIGPYERPGIEQIKKDLVASFPSI